LPEDPTVAESDIQADQHLSSATQAVPTQNQSGVANSIINAAAAVPATPTPAAQAADVPLPASPVEDASAPAPAPAPAPEAAPTNSHKPLDDFFTQDGNGNYANSVNPNDYGLQYWDLTTLPEGTTDIGNGFFGLPNNNQNDLGRIIMGNGDFVFDDNGNFKTTDPNISYSHDGLTRNTYTGDPVTRGNGKPVAGGKRKRGGASPWTDFVKQHYHELKKKDPDITLAKAAKHASEAWKAKKAKKS